MTSDPIRDQTAFECLREAIDHPGYTRRMRLTAAELAALRAEIEGQWLRRIESAAPALAAQARALGMARYHELAPPPDHEQLWPKGERILAADAVARLRRLPLFGRLREVFGPFSVAEGFHGSTHVAGLEEIYWRLVRPGVDSDVGPLHADCWFHDIMDMRGRAFPEQCFTMKIWIPVYCERGRNGLMMVPESHLRDWKHSTRWVNGQPKPSFDDDAQAVLIPTEPGEMLIFHERTLHGGARNQGERTRVSAEITLVFPSEQHLRERLGVAQAA